MKTISSSQARKNFFKLLAQTATSHEPVQITWKDSNAILLSQEDWESIQETLFLLSIPGMREKIMEGLNAPLNECKENLDW